MSVLTAPLAERQLDVNQLRFNVFAHPLLTERSYVIDFNDRGLFAQVLDGWKKFLAEDQEYKDSWEVSRADNEDPDGKPDDGYILKKGEPKASGGFDDRKEYFHYRPDLTDFLDEKGVSWHRHSGWLQICHRLYRLSLEHCLEVARELDNSLPGYNFEQRMNTCRPGRHALRLLHYHERIEPNKLLGKQHVDRNFMTLHLFETHPGLRIRRKEAGEWVEYRVVDGKVLSFLGQKAQIFCPQQLWGVPHLIKAPADAQPQEELRYSMVFFAHIEMGAATTRMEKVSY